MSAGFTQSFRAQRRTAAAQHHDVVDGLTQASSHAEDLPEFAGMPPRGVIGQQSVG